MSSFIRTSLRSTIYQCQMKLNFLLNLRLLNCVSPSGKKRSSRKQDHKDDDQQDKNLPQQGGLKEKFGSQKALEKQHQNMMSSTMNMRMNASSMGNNPGIVNTMLGGVVPYRYGPPHGHGTRVGFGGYGNTFPPDFHNNGSYPMQMPMQHQYWRGGPFYMGHQFRPGGMARMNRNGMSAMPPGVQPFPMSMFGGRGPYSINHGVPSAAAFAGPFEGQNDGTGGSNRSDFGTNSGGDANGGTYDEHTFTPDPENLSPPSQAAQDTNNKATSMGLLTGRNPVPLYMSCDDDSLSAYQCTVRKQIEIFEARIEDVESNAQGRNKPITLGQVGIRCRHCTRWVYSALQSPCCRLMISTQLIKSFFLAYSLHARNRARASVYYPAKLLGLYQAAQVGRSPWSRPCPETLPSLNRHFYLCG
jgi:hypothetical protein